MSTQKPPRLLVDSLWAPKAMFMLTNVGLSSMANYLAVYYEHTAGYSKIQIGYLQTLACICTVVGPPIWGAAADYWQLHRAITFASILLGAAILFCVSLTCDYKVTVAIVVLGNLVRSPSGPLLNQAVLDMISRGGGEYGKQRLFGAVGYGAGAYIASLAVALGGISSAFYVSLAFSLSSLVVLHHIPVARSHHGDHILPRKASFLRSAGLLFHQLDVVVLLGIVLVLGVMYGVISSFLTLNLYNLSGQNVKIIGVAIMCETVSELPAFFFSHRIIRKTSIVGVLVLSLCGYALRITYYAFMTNAWSAIPFEFLHGLTFGITWAAVTQYMYAAAPPGSEGLAMGLLSATLNGLGKGCGTLVGGYFYEHFGARTMWLVADLGVPVSALGIVLFARVTTSKRMEEGEWKGVNHASSEEEPNKMAGKYGSV